jgi:hypothetical protein
VAGPARLFFCCDHEDEYLCKQLEAHFSVLVRTGVVVVWHRRRITAGQDWAGAIDEEIQRADIELAAVKARRARRVPNQCEERPALVYPAGRGRDRQKGLRAPTP